MNVTLSDYRRLLGKYFAPQRVRVLLLAVLMLGSVALELTNPQIVRHYIDAVTTTGATSTLALAALLYIAFAVAQRAASLGAAYMGEGVGWTATNGLRADLALHCLKLDLSFHNARTPGELIERVDGDVNALSNFFSQFMLRLVSSALVLVGALALMFREDWRIGLAMSAFAVFAIFLLVRIRSFAVPYWKEVRQVSADFFGFVGERLAGTEDIRANGATGYTLRRFHEILRRWLPINRKAGLAGFSM